MRIEEMTPDEKSIELLHLMDVWVKCTNKQNAIWAVMLGDDAIATDVCPRGLRSEFDHWQHVLKTVSPNLYAPENMALAWRVLNWANGNQMIMDYWQETTYVEHEMFVYWFVLTPQEAQTAWLDKILQLAIEAGVVE